MDPNETLRQLRAAIGDAYAICDDEETECALDALQELATLAEALDQWISRGGFLPREWERKENDHA
jgi:hypothetical protein